MRGIPIKEIWRQIKKDLIGKDSYRGVTLTYAWMANQFGHFSLGFIPTCLLHLFLRYVFEIQRPELWAALVVSGFWLLFELANVFISLIKNNKVNFMGRKRKRPFPVPWKDIRLDTFTDLCFFWFGASSAYWMLVLGWNWVIMAPLCLLILGLIRHWYPLKMYVQYARYPFQFRLSQWHHLIDPAGEKTVIDFTRLDKAGHHILLFGLRRTGKTSLAVGMATEFSLRCWKCSYTTAVKLLSLFLEKEPVPLTEDELWTWLDASVLVIDDINPDNVRREELITTEVFSRFLGDEHYRKRNRQAISSKNVIWVLGSEMSDRNKADEWVTYLNRELGVPPDRIFTIQFNAGDPKENEIEAIRYD